MFQQDYIMRQIQQFTRALERVLAKKEQKQEEQAQHIISETLSELTEEYSHNNFLKLTLGETEKALTRNKTFNGEIALIVADLLYEKGQLTADRTEKKHCYQQAYLLYQRAMQKSNAAVPLASVEKISDLKSKLDSSSLEKIKKMLGSPNS